MRINGIDIGDYNGHQHAISWVPLEFSTSSEWISGASIPHFVRPTTGFKALTVRILVKGDSRQAIHDCASRIIALFVTGEANFELDRWSRRFTGSLRGNPKYTETSVNRWHTIEATFVGYEHDELVPVSGTGELRLHNPGTLQSPAVIRIIPAADGSHVALSGCSRSALDGRELDIVLGSVTAGHEVVIDGITGLITDNGALKADISIGALPTLAPGWNVVSCSQSSAEIHVDVMPIYA